MLKNFFLLIRTKDECVLFILKKNILNYLIISCRKINIQIQKLREIKFFLLIYRAANVSKGISTTLFHLCGVAWF
mgnify:CR=1 FL=1